DSAVTYLESRDLRFQNTGNTSLAVTLQDVPEFVTPSSTTFEVSPGDTLTINLALNELGRSQPELLDSLFIVSNDITDSLFVLNLATRVNNVVVLGLKDQVGLSQLYPNPTEGTLFLEFEQPNQELEVEIVDLSGQTLFQQKIRYLNEPIQMEVPPHTPGFYILRVKSRDGRSASQTLIIK
ncbi:MAG TPA: hypothetical protein DCP28_08660, partial [Cytophagales bacterium]|nr:hypothetical protein [Cytophagales bacterium]